MFLRKLHTSKDTGILDDKAQIAYLVHFDSPCWSRVYRTHVVGILVCQIFLRNSVMSMFLS